MKNLIEMIADNSIMIIAVTLIFLSGVGIGAAVTDLINDKEHDDDEDHTTKTIK